MAYKRTATAAELPRGDALTADLIGIGMLFAGKEPEQDPNIEDTLLAASIEGMEKGDLRVLSVLVTWLEIHHPRVNADRLVRAVRAQPSKRVRAFWAAVPYWLKVDHRLTRLKKLYKGPRLDLLPAGTQFQISRRGEDERFSGSPLRVPAGVLRDRPKDVLPPDALARRHLAYRYRILLGPSYRADMWAALERDPSLPPAELARRAYGSFATAWRAVRDHRLLAA